jgi:hypothetical protein
LAQGKQPLFFAERFITTEKLVAELMREMGLKSISTISKRFYLKWQKGENKNILQRRIHVEEPDQVYK